MITIVVTGGRDYQDKEAVNKVLNSLRIIRLAQGGAWGADHLALEWAIDQQIVYQSYRADWITHGRAVGPIRNKEMLIKEKPDLVIAFPGGAGTANCIKTARELGILVLVVQP